ncbi:hypothetical protein [Gracilibacillus salinarum]|uniref:Sulfotransferase family protein n=1 Tax=Gracilibacillus salinarum TaxID=2932255 RepID=A0ABY4GK42_9BACI|nr:hypothetical protein [Gracilibacillus salinarum]UOQ84350.1 hypothetical protein MUN87_16885 [Gracilibacillus salinarum]
MEKKKFLVLGHPRSGTGFTAKLLRQFGYDIGHESMGADGISSWMLAVDDYQVFIDPKIRRPDFDFDYIIMCVRNPVDMISSVYYTENLSPYSLNFRKKYVNVDGLNNIEVAVKSVLEWYRLIEKQRPHLKLRIDRDPEVKLHAFLRRFVDPETATIAKLGKVNTRKHNELSLDAIIEHCNPALREELRAFCHLYEYRLSFNRR